MGEILLGIVVLVIFFVVFAGIQEHDTKAIHEFMNKSHRQVVKIERHNFTYGPFILVDNSDRVYEVKYNNEYNETKTAWVRFGIFTTWNNPDGSNFK